MGMTIDNLCDSCTNIGCIFQSGIVRTECAFYMPPHIEPDNCGNYVVMQPTVRLIDADVLREEVNSWGMNDYEPSDFTDAIDDAPTVEAIPKDQYEARLKADLVAMLEQLDSEIQEQIAFMDGSKETNGLKRADNLVKDKINALKQSIWQDNYNGKKGDKKWH